MGTLWDAERRQGDGRGMLGDAGRGQGVISVSGFSRSTLGNRHPHISTP